LECLEDPENVTEKAKKAEKSDAVKKKKQKMQDYKKELAGFLGRKSRQNNPEQLDPIKKSKDGAEQQSPCFFVFFRSVPRRSEPRTRRGAGAKLPKTAAPFLRSFWSRAENGERRRKSFLLATTHAGSRCRRRKRTETPAKRATAAESGQPETIRNTHRATRTPENGKGANKGIFYY
jgi:hypothetical protein